MATNYSSYISRRSTPQNRPIPGREREMVKNNAGGYVFQVEDLEYLRRVLILGTMGGTYYVSEQKLTQEAMSYLADVMRDAMTGIPALDEARAINVAGASPFQEPAFVALAMGLASPDVNVRRHAGRVFHDMVRIPTHLYTVMRYVKEMRGTGKLLRKTVESWLHHKTPEQLAFHAIKYAGRTIEQQRWAFRDVLRIAHPKPANAVYDAVFAYIANGEVRENAPNIIHVYELMKRASKNDAIELIREHKLTWELVPGNLLGDADVWRALLPNLPINALLRNLGRLSALGVIKPLSPEEEMVAQRIASIDKENARKARLHPLNVFKTLQTYASGHGNRGSLEWTVSEAIAAELDDLFNRSFGYVEPTGKRMLVALDVSGSMYWGNVFLGLASYQVAALLGLMLLKAEPHVHMIAVDVSVYPNLRINKQTSFVDAANAIKGYGGGGTNLALPFEYAINQQLDVDVFIVLTDNETWAGAHHHPVQAFAEYQRRFNKNAIAIVVAMALNRYSIADPRNKRMFNAIGFDTNLYQHISAIVASMFA